MPSPKVLRLVALAGFTILVGLLIVYPRSHPKPLTAMDQQCEQVDGDGNCIQTLGTSGTNGAAPAPAPAPAPAAAAPAPAGGSCDRSCNDQGCGCICTADCGGAGPPGSCCPSACGPVSCSTSSSGVCDGDPPSQGPPQCGQCLPSSCVCSADGWICTNDCQPPPPGCGSSSGGSSQSSQNSSASNSSSSGGATGPAPAAAPAPAPGSSSAGSSVSSTNSISSNSSSSTGNNGPAPAAPAPAPSGCIPDMRGCAGGCMPGTMPAMWEFTIGGLAAGAACTEASCAPAVGTFRVLMDSEELGFSCQLTKAISPAVCPSQVNPSQWKLVVTEPRQAPNGESYTASLTLGDTTPPYYHFGAWNCNAPNIFELLLTPGLVCAPQDEQVIVSPVSSCVNFSSSSRQSSTSSTNNSQSSGASSTGSQGSSTGQSSSSSSAVTTSCDGLTCFLGGLLDCQQRGFQTCTATNNPPSCHICSNPTSSSSSVTGLVNSSSSKASAGASSSRTSSAGTSNRTSSQSSTKLVSSAASSATTGPRCGDGLVQGNETCDDGANNGDPSSKCAASCDLALGQVCTLNVQCDSARCVQGRCLAGCAKDSDCPDPLFCGPKNICTLPTCGDGHVSPGEDCDAGSTCTSDPASCNRAPGTAGVTCLCPPDSKSCPHNPDVTWLRGCVAPPGFCGDGVLDTNTEVFFGGVSVNRSLRREECDLGEGNGLPGAPCSSVCTVVLSPFCGNGTVDPGEACDEGVQNGTPDAKCTSLCGIPPVANTGAGNDFESPNLTPGHTAASYELPLLPVRVNSNTTADLTRLSTGHSPVAQTGPETLLAIAMGAGFGWTLMRRRKQ